MPVSKKIIAKKDYTLEEIMEILKKDATLPAEPYEHKILGRKSIQIPATAAHVVDISVKKDKITVQEAPKPSIGNFAVDTLTDGWSSMIGRGVTSIDEIVKAVAAEVERIFGK